MSRPPSPCLHVITDPLVAHATPWHPGSNMRRAALLQCFYGVPELRSAVASYALAPTGGDGPAPGHRWAAGPHTPRTDPPPEGTASRIESQSSLMQRRHHPLGAAPALNHAQQLLTRCP